MSTVKYCDNYNSTLASSYTAGGTTLSVSSAGSGDSQLPTSGDFYLLVKAEGSNSAEMFKVTARSGTTLTVVGAQAGTTASNHASGAVVKGVMLTGDVMRQLQTKSILSDEKPTGTLNYIKVEKTTLPVSASGFITIHEYTGGEPGYISNLWFGITSASSDAGGTRNDSTLKITVDGTVIYNDRVPLYFGAEYQLNQTSFMSRYIAANNNNTDNVGFSSFIPIPFSSSFKIELKNGHATFTGFVWATGTYHTGVLNNWNRTRKLRTASGTSTGNAVNTVKTLVDVSGVAPGRLMGLFMSIDAFPGSANPQTAALEGNVKIYLDGASSPNYETPGTEDYFLMSNYMQGYTSGACSDFFGLPIKSTYTFNMYRFHILDPIVFENALKITWNCGDSTQVNFTGTQRLAWCVWYYTE